MVSIVFTSAVSADVQSEEPFGDIRDANGERDVVEPMGGTTVYSVKVYFQKVYIKDDTDWDFIIKNPGECHFDWTIKVDGSRKGVWYSGKEYWSIFNLFGDVSINTGETWYPKTKDGKILYTWEGNVDKGSTLRIEIDGWERDWVLKHTEMGDHYKSITINNENDIKPPSSGYDLKNWKLWYYVFVTRNEPPTEPTGLSDLKNRVTQDSPVVSWTASTDKEKDYPITYDVLIREAGASGSFTVADSTTDTSTDDLGTLEDGKGYHWKVRARDKAGMTSEDSATAFFALNDPPDPPDTTNLGDEVQDRPPVVEWEESTGNDDYGPSDDEITYIVESKDKNSDTWAEDCQTKGLSCELDRWDWSPGEWGRWRVRAYDGHESSAWAPSKNGDYFAMSQNRPPYAPYSPTPANGATDQPTDVTLEWKSDGDPDDGDTVTFDVYFGTDPTPDDGIPLLGWWSEKVATDHTSTSYDPGELELNTQYYWKIVAKDDQGARTESEIWDFWTIQERFARGTVENSDGNPLINMRVELEQQSGSGWNVVDTVFTNNDGEYEFEIISNDQVVDGRNTRVTASLLYSPSSEVFRLVDESVWGDGVAPPANPDPVAERSREFTLSRSSDHTEDLSFSANDGGRVYEVLVTSYDYFRSRSPALIPTGAFAVEINDDDRPSSYFEAISYTVHYSPTHGRTRCIVAHEYGHLISNPWSVPYNPIDENWANFASSLARGTPQHDFSGDVPDISVDSDTNGISTDGSPNDAWWWQLAGTMWDLNHDNVVDTLRRDSPQTVQDFYTDYRNRDSSLLMNDYNDIYRNHGYTNLVFLQAQSPVHIHIYDSVGRHVGLNYSTGDIDLQIPNASYFIDNGHESIAVFLMGDYSVIAEGHDEGHFALLIEYPTSNTSYSIAEYLNIPVDEETNASVFLSTTNPDYLMNVDTDKDGVTDYTVNPAILEIVNSSATDHEAPKISVPDFEEGDEYYPDKELNYTVEDNIDPSPSITYNYPNGFVFIDEGLFTIEIVATDSSGNQAIKRITFTIINKPPVAVVGPHQDVLEDTNIFFDASGSQDTSGDLPTLLYEWDFDNDGLYDDGIGIEAVWIWSEPGDYTIGLRVTDDNGAFDIDRTTIRAHEKKPAQVICVPFVASYPTVSHETWHGGIVILKGVTHGYGASQYKWDFGDGTGTGWLTITDNYALEGKHVYRGDPGTPFKAILYVRTDWGEESSDDYHIVIMDRTLEVERRVFIDDALWWLHKQMVRGEYAGGVEYGYWDSPYWPNNWNGAHTGASVQAFENNGHLPGGDETEDPYVETVRRGLNYLLAHAHTYHISASGQRGDPDSNHNGIGLVLFTDADEALYEAGITLMAVASSGDPDRIAEVSVTNIHNRRYGDIVRDMVDWIVFAQVDSGWGRGGWGYNPYRGGRARPDNSVSQWPAIGLEAAETNFGIAAPDWVKSELRDYWLRRTQNANGGFGYTSAGEWVNVAKTGAGIAMLKYTGVPENDNRIQRAVGFLNAHWNDQSWSNEHLGSYYSMYGIMKGMMIAPEIEKIGSRDWFEEYVQYIVNRRYQDGYVEDTTWLGVHYAKRDLVTAWAILILTKEVFSAPPVAVADASPRDVGKDQDVCFDGSGSYHPNPNRHIALYEWDFENDGQFDEIGVRVCHAYPDYGTYVATLRVTDDGVPALIDTTTITITVTLHNHAPVSDPDGPYKGFLSYPVTIYGTESYDPDELTLNDTIVAYGWELDGAYPYDFNEASTEIANWTWHITGTHNIGLIVTDSYGLTHTKWTTVTIVENKRPVAMVGGPYTAWEGSLVIFDGSASYDPDGTIERYDWDLDGDGVFEKHDAGPNPSGNWSDDYDGKVGLRVTDNGGGISVVYTTLEVKNVDPVADAGPDRTDHVGIELIFVGSAIDPGNDTHTYEWNFGDGKSAVGEVVLHSYSAQGVYSVTLTVTDDDHGVGVSNCTVYIWRENAVLSEPYATIVYSDSTVINGTLLDDDNETLVHQQDAPKVVVLEYWDGGNWTPISANILNSSDDSAHQLEFPLSMPQVGLDLPSGTYELRFRFVGDDYYNSTESYGSLIVLREDSVLSDPSGTVTYSDDTVIKVTMLDNDGEVLLHQADTPKTVYLEYNNNGTWIVISQDTLSSGSDFELDFQLETPHSNFDEPAGTYEIRVIYYGDNRYNTASNAGTLTVLKEDVAISEPNGTIVYSDDLIVSVSVTDDDGSQILHQEDEIKTMYLEYRSGASNWTILDIQNLTGVIGTFNFSIPDDFDPLPGSYDMRIRFDGDSRYNSAISQGELTVIKEDTILLDPSCTVMYGEEVTTYVLLLDNDDEVLLHQSDEPKTVYLDFYNPDDGSYIPLAQYTLDFEGDPVVPLTFQFTDNVTYPVPPFDDGEHTIRVSFNGDSRYNPTETNGILTILNRPPEVNAGADQTVDEGDMVHFDASGSTDIDNNPTDDIPYLTYYWDFDNDSVWNSITTSPYATFVFSDDSVNLVTLQVMDDDFANATDTLVVTVGNVDPEASIESVYIDATLTLRVAGEKWHNVGMRVYEDGVAIGYVEIERYPGDPDKQSKSIAFHVSLGKSYIVNLTFDARADGMPINGQIWGANPVWVILDVEGSNSTKVHHTFNVRHGGPVQSCDIDFTSTLNQMTLTFIGVATDPGSDDLTFHWDWGDGFNETRIYYNDNVGPDPYPSQFGGNFPFFVRDVATHAYSGTGTYVVTLTIADDDGGQTVVIYTAVIDQTGSFVTGNGTCGCGIHIDDDKPGNDKEKDDKGNQGKDENKDDKDNPEGQADTDDPTPQGNGNDKDNKGKPEEKKKKKK